MSKQDMRKERKEKLKSALKNKMGNLTGKQKEIMDELIEDKSRRTQEETLNKSEKTYRKNSNMFPMNKPLTVLTESGFEKINRKGGGGLKGGQPSIDIDKDGMITGQDFKLMAKKKYGGKITYRMSGGKVAGAGYDD